MKYFLLFAIFYTSLFAIQTSDKLFECTEIFKERKSELLVELERIDEQKQALSTLQIATEELLKQKEIQLNIKEEKVEKSLVEVAQKEENIKKLLAKNEEVLKQLTDIKMTKVSETFAKMKPSAASGILSKMDPGEAALILNSLKPKTVGQILTKMDASKASKLTLLLTK